MDPRSADSRHEQGELHSHVRQLMGSLLDTALQLVEGRHGSLMLLDGQKRLRLREARGLDPAWLEPDRDHRSGPAGRALREMRPLHLVGSLAAGVPVDESIILPLSTSQGAAGTLNLSRRGGTPWPAQLRDQVIRFSDGVSQTLEVVRLSRDRDRRMAELDRVLAFSRIFGSTRELSKILELLLSCARELSACQASFATLYTPAGERHEAWAGHCLAEPVLHRVIQGLRERFGHRFFARARPEHHARLDLLDDDHPLKLLAREGLARSAVVVPLVFGYRILGRLYLLDADEQVLHRDTLRLLMLLAHEASIAIDQGRAIRELQEMAFVDPLTRVYNRNYWIQRFEEELVRGERRGQPLSLIMLDIDHFKAYNDTYGHLVGDEVLRMVAQVVRACLREVDVTGRFGGEEFGILLPDTDEHGANFVAERIRLMVERLDLGRPRSAAGGLTISLGVACAGGRRLSVDELIRQADTALFVSKEQGRNRVSIYATNGVQPAAGLPMVQALDEADTRRLTGTSDFLFQMADSLGGVRECRPLGGQLGFQILVLGGAAEEHLPLVHLFDSLGYQTLLEQPDTPRIRSAVPLGQALPDLAVLDLEVPPAGVDGLTQLRDLKTHDPLLPVIVLTGRDGIERAVEAIRLGADDYLLKPFGAKEIRLCVEKAFSKRFRLLQGDRQGAARSSDLSADLTGVSDEIRREFVRSAQELRIMQEFNRRSLEHPTQGALMLDAQRRVLQLNRLAAEMLGIDEAAGVGRSLFGAAPSLDNPRVGHALIHVEQTGEEATINDFWLKSPGGETSALHKLRFIPVVLDGGDALLLILLENMLDRQLIQEEGRRLRMRIAREIHGRIAQHLQVISGRAELLSLDGEGGDASVEQILAAARRVSQILGELGADLPGDGLP
jgi:diguanylate cyclase (GGDEF)-like protein